MNVSGFVLVDEAGSPLVVSVGSGSDLIKSHVRGYTRKDGTFVKEHDDNRQAAAPASSSAPKSFHTPEAAAEKLKAAGAKDIKYKSRSMSYTGKDGKPRELAYSEPSGGGPYGVDGDHLDHHLAGGGAYDHPDVVGEVEKRSDGKMHASFNFAGKKYHATSDVSRSKHDGTPVRAYESYDGMSGDSDGYSHRVWVDSQSRVHADDMFEIPHLRAKREAEVRTAKAAASGS